VPRWTRIRYNGLDLEGRPISREAEGFHARVVQHECDHLDGVLYPQRMDDLRDLVFSSELKHWAGTAPHEACARPQPIEEAS
jgi:peptide deformylase